MDLKELRKYLKGKNLAELSRKSGVEIAYLCRVKKGKQKPKPITISSIAYALGLLTEEEAIKHVETVKARANAAIQHHRLALARAERKSAEISNQTEVTNG